MEIVGPAAGVSAYQVVWTRYGVHLTFMLLLFGPRRGTELVRTRRLGSQIVASLLMLGMPLSFIWELQRMSVPDASVVFWIAPALIVLISILTHKQYGGFATIAATLVGLLGAILICSPDASVFRRAAVLGVGMAGCFALYMVVVRSMQHEPIVTKLFHTALWVFLSLTIGLPMFWKTPTARGMLAMTAIGLLGWLGLLALDLAIEAMPIGLLAPVLYTQLVWDMLIQWPLRMEPVDTKTVIGAGLALGAAVPALMRRSSSTASRHAAGEAGTPA